MPQINLPDDKPNSVSQPPLFDHKPFLAQLANSSGVYRMFDADQAILYVGKAKNLKKRVSSYFTKNQIGKTAVLVKQIVDIKTIVVGSEIEALLLENNLIKKYQPKYNIMLKDDKTYPWICIKNERFPRIFSTRNVVKDGSHYFGPYASVKMMNTILDLIRELYQLRNCNYNLSEQNIADDKFKVCLEHHIGNCNAPCVNNQTEEDYNTSISEIKSAYSIQPIEIVSTFLIVELNVLAFKSVKVASILSVLKSILPLIFPISL